MTEDLNKTTDPFNFPVKRPAPQLVYEQVAKENPDQVAEVNHISKTMGTPSDFVAAHLPEAKLAARYSPEFWAGIETQYPKTAKWAAIPKNMAVAHDDLDNLTAIEGIHKSFVNKLKSMGGAVAGMVEATGGILSASGSLDKLVLGTGDIQKSLGKDIADYGRKMAAYYNVEDPTFADKLVSAATSSAVFFVPGMGIVRGASILAAMPRLATFAGAGASAAFESAIEAGAVHETMKQKGFSDSQALAAAAKTFTMNIGLNTALNYGGGIFAKAIPGKATIAKGSAIIRGAKDAAKAGSAEFLQEGSQQIISNSATKEPLMSGTMESAILGGLVGGGMSSVMDAGNRLGERKRAQAARDYVNDLSAAVVKSKTIARSPDALEGVMKEIQAPPVLIPVEAFETRWKEAGIEPEQAAKELNATESYNAAKENGGDVVVDMALFQSKLMDEHRAGFLNDIRLDPTHATRNEEIAADEQIGKLMQAQVEQAEKDLEAQANPETIARRGEDRKAIETLYRQNDEVALKDRFGDEEGAKVANTIIPLQARLDSVLLERARKARPDLTAAQFYQERKTALKSDNPALWPDGTPMVELTPEEVAQVDADNYMEAVKDMGGVTPTLDAIRALGGIDWAKVKKAKMGLEMADLEHLGIFRKGGKSVGEMAQALGEKGQFAQNLDEDELAALIEKESREANKFRAAYGEAKYQKMRGSRLYQAATDKTVFAPYNQDLAALRSGAKSEAHISDIPDEIARARNIPAEIFIDDKMVAKIEGKHGVKVDAAFIEALYTADELVFPEADPKKINFIKRLSDERTLVIATRLFDKHFVVTGYESSKQSHVKNIKNRGEIIRNTGRSPLSSIAQPEGRRQPERISGVGPDNNIIADTDGKNKGGELHQSDLDPVASLKQSEPKLIRNMFKTDQEFMDAVRQAYNLDDEKNLSRNEKAAKRWLEKFGGEEQPAPKEKIAELEEITAAMERRPARAGYRGSYDPIARLRTLGPNADASTVIHEFMHGYFIDVWNFIKTGKADEVTAKDFATLRAWATADPKEVIAEIKAEADGTKDKARAKALKGILSEIKKRGGAKFIKEHADTKFLDGVTAAEREIARQFHERMARGFEFYMREGKAPVAELTGIFDNFRAWLVKVYKTASDLRVELSADVRAVFDRMVAAEDEISHAELEIGMNDGELAAAFPPDAAAALQRVRDAAHEAAMSEVTARLMVELSPKYKEMVEAKRQAAIKAFTAQVGDLPLYRAITSLKDLFPGKTPDTLARAYQAEDTAADIELAFDDVAQAQNFKSADELAKAILGNSTLDMAVQAHLFNYMKQFAPAHKDERIKEWALQAVNGEAQLEVLAMEKDMLSDLGISQAFGTPYQERARRARVEEARIARNKAKAKLEGMTVKAATSYLPYINYEKKAAVKVAQALAEKDYKAARVYKLQEMANHALMFEAIRLKEVVKKAVAYLETAGTKTDKLPSGGKLSITPEANEQVNALLFRYRLALPLPVAVGKSKVSLKQYVEGIKTRGDEVKVSDWIIENVDSNNHSIQELTVEQLLDLKDAVKSLKYSGHRAKVFSTGEDIADFSHEKAVGIRNNLKARPVKYEPGDTNYILDKTGEFIHAHRLLTWICKTLDGFQHGDVSKFVMGRLRKARHNESVMGDKAAAKLEEIISKHYPASDNPFKKWETRAKLSSRKYVVDDKTVMEIFPGGVTKETAIMMWLNQGTELNRVRLLESYAHRIRGIDGRMEWVMPLGQEHIDKIIGILDKADVEFGQDVLDHVNSFWPQTAELERSRTGVMPIGREAIEINTKFGKFKGGYFHIAYDPRYSEKAATQSLEAASKGDAGYATPSTPSSHIKETVNHVFGRPLHLQFGAIDRHLKEVVHRLSFIETIRDLDLFFTNPEVTDAIVSTMGAKVYRQIRPVLVAVGFENSAKDNPVESIWDGLRVKTTAYYLMFRFASMAAQLSGVATAMRSVGPANYLLHLKNLTPSKFQFMMANSMVMPERIGNRDRDVRDAVRAEMKKGHPMSGIKKYGFFVQGYIDVFVSIPQWYAAFDNEINRQAMAGEKIKPEDAVIVADEVVQANQGSGDPIDQSAMQRGTPFMKLLSMFYTPFAPYANAELEVWDRLRERGIKDMPTLMSFMTFNVFLGALIEAYVKGQLPKEDDDDNAWYAWAAKAVSSQVFGGWIGVRDAANYLANGGKMGYRLTPTEGAPVTVLAPFVDLSKMAGNKFADTNYDVSAEKLAQDTADSFMFMAKLPGKQIDLITKYVFALLNGDEKGSKPARILNPEKK